MPVGTVRIAEPGAPTFYHSIGTSPWKTLWMTTDSLLPLSTYTDIKPVLYEAKDDRLSHALTAIYQLPEQNRAIEASALTYELLLSLSDMLLPYTEKNLPKEVTGIERAVVYMQMHYTEPISTATLADIAEMPYAKFIRCFSKMYEASPAEYIRAYRFHTISEYLKRMGNISLNEVAKHFGFGTASQLCALFRHFGTTPDTVRSKLSNIQHWRDDDEA